MTRRRLRFASPDRAQPFANRNRRLVTTFLLVYIAGLLFETKASLAEQMKKPGEDMKLTSSAFEEGKPIPSKYTCDGEDVSPPLAWTEAPAYAPNDGASAGKPAGAKSLALISDDPDAPGKTWVHWVIFNIPPERRELKEDVPKKPQLADGTVQGMTDFRTVGYGGPCPPGGTHRYFFRLYALDTKLALTAKATKADLMKAIEGHVLAEGQLMGTYKR